MERDPPRHIGALLILLAIALIGISVTRDFRPGPKEPPPESERVELVCPIRANYPGRNEGRVLTIYCSPQVAKALGLEEEQP